MLEGRVGLEGRKIEKKGRLEEGRLLGWGKTSSLPTTLPKLP